MNTAIRQSPSGPVVANTANGPYKPGVGARLRLVEATSTVGDGVIPTAVDYPSAALIGPAIGSGAPLSVTLPAVDTRLNYRATVLCDVVNPSTNVAGRVQLFLEGSWDAGATWHELASNAHAVLPCAAGGSARQIRCDLPLSTGGSQGFVSGADLTVRARVGAQAGGNANMYVSAPAVGDGASRGSVLLQLEECF